MKTIRRRLLAMLLALLVCCSLATTALAADGPAPSAGIAKNATVESPAAGDTADKGYVLREDTVIEDDETPLAAGVVETRCVLHLVLFLLTFVVAVCFLYSRQKHLARQRELLTRLGR